MTEETGNFHRAIVDYMAPNRDHPQYQVWLDYALSTNQRGQYVVDTLLGITPSLRGKRFLDIGCGYGGTCLAATRAGATAVGIDIDPILLDFAAKNTSDHPQLAPTFHELDALDRGQIETLGQFDVITCDNVIEHVAIPEILIANLGMLMSRKGFAYITIPNAFSLGQVRVDCHYGLFGISLLDPWDATVYVQHAIDQPSYDVSLYYTYAQYVALFQRYHLEPRLQNPLHPSEEDVLALEEQGSAMPGMFEEVVADRKVPDQLVDKLAELLDIYRQQLLSRLRFYKGLPGGPKKIASGRRLMQDYGEEVWYVVAAPDWRAIRSYNPRFLLRKVNRRLRNQVRARLK